jgi:hypothetical protein
MSATSKLSGKFDRGRQLLSRGALLAGAAAMAGLLAASSSPANAAPFQKYLNGSCPNAQCIFDLAIVPAGKTLFINNASCYLRTDDAADFYALQLLVKNAADATISAVTLGPINRQYAGNTATNTFIVYQINNTISAFAPAGGKFQVFAERRDGAWLQVACHISGQLKP